jgi:hypothetical protein
LEDVLRRFATESQGDDDRLDTYLSRAGAHEGASAEDLAAAFFAAGRLLPDAMAELQLRVEAVLDEP